MHTCMQCVAVCSPKIRDMPLRLPPILPTDGSKPMPVVKDSRGFRVGGRRYVRRDGAGASAARLPSIGAAAARTLDAAGRVVEGSQLKDSKMARSYATSGELPGEDHEAAWYCDGQAKNGGKGVATPTVDEEATRIIDARDDCISGLASDPTEPHVQGLELTVPRTSKLIATDGPLLVQGKQQCHKSAHPIPQADCCSTTVASNEAVYGALRRAPDPLGCSHLIMCRPPLPTKGSGPIHAQRDGNRYAAGGRRYVATTTTGCWIETQSTLATPCCAKAAHVGDQAPSSSRSVWSGALDSRDDPAAGTTQTSTVTVCTDKPARDHTISQASHGDNCTNSGIIPDNNVVPSTSAVHSDKHSASTAEMCVFKTVSCLMVSQLSSNPVHAVDNLVASSHGQRHHSSDPKSPIASPTLTLSRRASPSHSASCSSSSVSPSTTASPSSSATSLRPSSSNVSSPTGRSSRSVSPTISPCPSLGHSRRPTTSPPPISTPPPTISPLPTHSIPPTSSPSASATVSPLPTISLSPPTVSNLDQSKKADSGFEEITTEDSCSEGEDERRNTKMESNQANEKTIIPTYGASYFSTFHMALNPSRERRAPRVQTAVIRRLD